MFSQIKYKTILICYSFLIFIEKNEQIYHLEFFALEIPKNPNFFFLIIQSFLPNQYNLSYPDRIYKWGIFGL